MSSIKEQVIAMLKTPQLASLATLTSEGKPWTRYVMVRSDDKFLIRSGVCLESRKVAQVRNNPEVHLTFGINDPRELNRPYVQIQGRARISIDPQEKKDNWFDMLSVVFRGPDDPKYGVLIIEPYRVEFNKPGVMTPEVWEK